MSSMATTARNSDHFEPEAALDPQEARKLRGHLEQIDYAAFAANRTVVAQTLGRTDLSKFERLAVAAAHARARWVSAAVSMTETASSITHDQVTQLNTQRRAFEELTEAYDAMRRMVERGYLGYQPRP
jgi:hypothetical protein